MNEPASRGDERPLAATVEDQSPISPHQATEPTSVQNSPLIPPDRGSLPLLPFHVAIADGGLEIEAKIKKEHDLEKLIKILQTIRPLLQNIYEPSSLADCSDPTDAPDPSDLGEHTQRVFDASMTPHEAETGMSFFITKAQKAELRRRGYSEEQIREMKPEDAHRALGLIR
ncbi:MAG: hypothetical protein WCA23_25880 [Stellaceae bacterium]